MFSSTAVARFRDWWTYPFLPYVDLWLEAFHRAEGAGDSATRRLGGVDVEVHAAGEGGARRRDNGEKSRKRPRWNGVAGQIVSGLAPLAAIVILLRVSVRTNDEQERGTGRGGGLEVSGNVCVEFESVNYGRVCRL